MFSFIFGKFKLCAWKYILVLNLMVNLLLIDFPCYARLSYFQNVLKALITIPIVQGQVFVLLQSDGRVLSSYFCGWYIQASPSIRSEADEIRFLQYRFYCSADFGCRIMLRNIFDVSSIPSTDWLGSRGWHLSVSV